MTVVHQHRCRIPRPVNNHETDHTNAGPCRLHEVSLGYQEPRRGHHMTSSDNFQAAHAEWVARQAPAPLSDTMLARDVMPGWHMAGVGTIDRISAIGNDQLAFTGTQGERAFKHYTLVEVTRPAPVMWAADPQSTAAQHEITAANVTEELETRLSAVIYTLGLLHSRTGINDFSDQLAAWELGHYTTGPNPVRSDALGLLATAAGIYTHISDTQAEVTAPAVPGQ